MIINNCDNYNILVYYKQYNINKHNSFIVNNQYIGVCVNYYGKLKKILDDAITAAPVDYTHLCIHNFIRNGSRRKTIASRERVIYIYPYIGNTYTYSSQCIIS